MSGTYHQSVQSGKWMLITNIVQKGLNVLTFFILARMLVPEDYGIIAVLFAVMGFFESFTTPGFEKALLQRKEDPEEHLKTAWTFYLIKSFAVAGIIFFGAPFVAGFFHIEPAVDVIRWGAAYVILSAFSSRKQFYFFRNLDFKKVSIRDITGQIAYTIVSITWAMTLSASVWALVAGHATRYVVSTLMTYVLAPAWPRFSFHFSRLKSLWWYSKWAGGQNILRYFLGIIDTVLVGRLMNAEQLGLYSKARELAYAPLSPFASIMQRIGLPAYARIQDEIKKVEEGLARTLDVILGIGVPIVLALAAEGGALIQVLLGPRWLSLVLPLKLLAFGMLLSALVTIIRPIFDAVGRPEINVKLQIVEMTTSAIFLWIGIHFYGLTGAAAAMLCSWTLNLAYAIVLGRKVLGLGIGAFKDSFLIIGRAVAAVALVALPAYALGIGRIEQPFVSLAWLSGLGTLYVIMLWRFGRRSSRGPWTTFLSILREMRS